MKGREKLYGISPWTRHEKALSFYRLKPRTWYVQKPLDTFLRKGVYVNTRDLNSYRNTR